MSTMRQGSSSCLSKILPRYCGEGKRGPDSTKRCGTGLGSVGLNQIAGKMAGSALPGTLPPHRHGDQTTNLQWNTWERGHIGADCIFAASKLGAMRAG